MDFPNALLNQLRSATDIVVLTGAGTSAESGVPTFRDAQTGLWAQYDPAQLATPEAFEHDPKLVWEWYAWRRSLVANSQPNAGHHALTAWQKQVPNLYIVTQNVDGLHQRAGSNNVIELHGNLTRIRCHRCGAVAESGQEADTVPPRCKHPQCDGFLRPDVVWFGEVLPAEAWQQAQNAVATCQILFSIGTSSLVYPAAALPEIALQNDITVVEINLNSTPLSAQVNYCLRGKSGEILPTLLAALEV